MHSQHSRKRQRSPPASAVHDASFQMISLNFTLPMAIVLPIWMSSLVAGGSNHHEGNKRYWRRILVERGGYKLLGKNDNVEKNGIAESVYDYILSTGGRFLQMDPKTEKWFNIPKRISLDKIKQALRDKYVPHFAKEEEVVLENEHFSALQPAAASPLPTPSGSNQQEEFNGFVNFLKNSSLPSPMASSPPPTNDLPTNDLYSTSGSIDFANILRHVCKSGGSVGNVDTSMDLFQAMAMQPNSVDALDEWNQGIGKLPSFQTHDDSSLKPTFENSLRGHSLDLMCADLITTTDNTMTMEDSLAQAAPMMMKKKKSSLQALLQQQMEAAIPSARTTTFVAAV